MSGVRNYDLIDAEDAYLRIEREGIVDEAHWAAINGTSFEGEKE